MFQYASAKSLASVHNAKLYLDTGFFDTNKLQDHAFTPRSFELGIFNISEPMINLKNDPSFFHVSGVWNTLKRTTGINYNKIYKEQTLKFDHNFFKTSPPVLLNGFFQSEMYFRLIRDMLINIFKFPIDTVQDLCKFEEVIKNCISISIHVRRGDYVSSKEVNAFHGICSIEYYQSAINKMDQLVGRPKYFIFSDDIEWANENLLLNDRCKIIDTRNMPTWCDMYLMSVCSHNIIANSSYSWWGAWLNQNSNKIVIAPERWFSDKSMNSQTQDLFPSTWLKI